MKRGIFFTGIIILVVSGLIAVYDYPQIMFLESLDRDVFLAEPELSDKQNRLNIEFSIGLGLVGVGTLLVVFGIFKKSS